MFGQTCFKGEGGGQEIFCILSPFSTEHVIKLIGVVSQSQPVLVLMELMENGDLKEYLRKHRLVTLESTPLSHYSHPQT